MLACWSVISGAGLPWLASRCFVHDGSVSLCAGVNTGRAAQRLQEEAGTSRQRATTLHRLLGYKSRSERSSKDTASGSGNEVTHLPSPLLLPAYSSHDPGCLPL